MSEAENKKEYDPVENFDKAALGGLNAKGGQSSSTGYEMSYLLTTDIPEDKIDSETIELKNIITENGGDIVQTNSPEKKRLAYPIRKAGKKSKEGIYFLFNLELSERFPVEIGKKLRLNEKVLRYLLVRVD